MHLHSHMLATYLNAFAVPKKQPACDLSWPAAESLLHVKAALCAAGTGAFSSTILLTHKRLE